MKKLSTFLMTAGVLLLGSAAMAGAPKVNVCHIPPGNPGNPRSISVGPSAVPAHLAHGDHLVSAEVCDGVDNDCDGIVDDDPGGVGQACTVGAGACAETGTVLCVDGAHKCDAEPGEPTTDVCDGIDNDCDGSIDENATAEVCDGVDNDCDGQIDQGFGVGEPCTDELNDCEYTGTRICTENGSGATCAPPDEVCDGIDNNCDGRINEGCVPAFTFCACAVPDLSTGIPLNRGFFGCVNDVSECPQYEEMCPGYCFEQTGDEAHSWTCDGTDPLCFGYYHP